MLKIKDTLRSSKNNFKTFATQDIAKDAAKLESNLEGITKNN